MAKSELIDAYDELGMTELLFAVFRGAPTGVQTLLQQRAAANKPQRDDPSATPLWHAQEDFALYEIAQELRAHDAC